MPIAVIFPLVQPPYVVAMGGGVGTGRFFAKVEGREVFLRCVELYAKRDQVSQRIVVVTPNDLQLMQEKYSAHLGFQGVTVAGGTSDWLGCVGRALEKLEADIDTVIVHDPACPAVAYTLLDALEEALGKYKDAAGVVSVLPSGSAFGDLEGATAGGGGGRVGEYVDMGGVYQVQSPQIFRRKALADAHAGRGSETFVDDGELVQVKGGKIATIAGSRLNQRIDSDEMVRLARDLIEHTPKPKPKTPLNPFGEAEW